MKCWPILLLFCGAAGAATTDRPPIYIAGGLDYLNEESRALTTDRGEHVALGWSDNVSAFFGIPSLDLDWGHAEGQGNSIDTFGLCYCERAMLTSSIYFGLGIGTFYSRVKLSDGMGGSSLTTGFRPGGRAMVGYDLTSTIFLEGSYFYSGTINGVNTNSLSLCLGFWF
jgi:hypothetical protein